MTLTCTTDEALEARTRVEGYPTFKRDYFVRAKGGEEPIGFLVEQDPHAVIHPHFHELDQYQVIIRGGGTLGKQEVGPVTVQYAAAHTGYGPIVAGDKGIFYFTLRPRGGTDTGPWYLPESKDRQREGGRPRARVGRVEPVESPTTAATAEVVPSEDDGVRSDAVVVPPGETWEGWDDDHHGPAYLLVLSGSAVVDGRSLDPWSCVYVEAGEKPEVAAGADGLQLLAMRFSD